MRLPANADAPDPRPSLRNRTIFSDRRQLRGGFLLRKRNVVLFVASYAASHGGGEGEGEEGGRRTRGCVGDRVHAPRTRLGTRRHLATENLYIKAA